MPRHFLRIHVRFRQVLRWIFLCQRFAGPPKSPHQGEIHCHVTLLVYLAVMSQGGHFASVDRADVLQAQDIRHV